MKLTKKFNDTELACKVFRKTALDYDIWCTSRLDSFWSYAISFVPPPSFIIENSLHPDIACLNGDNIQEALRRLRWALYLRDTLGPLGMHLPEVGDLVYNWIISRTMHDIGLLINQAIDLISATKATSAITQDPTLRCVILDNRELHAAVTLTTLYSLRKYLHDCSFNGIDVRSAPLIIPELKNSLSRFVLHGAAMTLTSPQNSGVYEILFWMYFTGVWQGQKQRCHSKSNTTCTFYQTTSLHQPDEKCPRHNSTILWFNAQLAMQARMLRRLHWPQARQLLVQFVYSDIMRPHPSTWYERIVGFET